MGFCIYQRNPSELYRRTTPGTAPETVCGGRTFPAVDEPEIVVVKTGMGPDGAIYEYRPTGRHVPRATDDPYCPDHGGSPAPPPPAVEMADLEHAYAAYAELAARYQAQPGAAIAVTPPAPAELTTGTPAQASLGLAPPAAAAPAPVTPGQVEAAARLFQDLAAQAQEQGVAR